MYNAYLFGNIMAKDEINCIARKKIYSFLYQTIEQLLFNNQRNIKFNS